MARVLTVLIALVAQGMALMSPVCFVRCVSANGHECLELTGQECHCQSRAGSPDVCAVVMCGQDREVQNQNELDTPTSWQVRCEQCSCQHSALEAAAQVQAKSLTSSGVSDILHVATLLAMRDFVSEVQAVEKASLSAFGGLRSQESPQLAVLATVVLRV